MTKPIDIKAPLPVPPSAPEPKESKVHHTAQESFISLKRSREAEISSTDTKKRKIEKKEQRIAQVLSLLKEANSLAWKHKEPHKELDRAIQIYSEAFYMHSDEKHKAIILLNWGLALIKRNNPAREFDKPPEEITNEERLYGAVSDADQAIARFHEGLVRMIY